MKSKRPTATDAVNAALKEMRDLSSMILQAIKPPANPTSQAEPPPHPLILNPNEATWIHHAVGPIDGWFSFGEHGNPPFHTPVQVLMTHPKTGARVCVGVGFRTTEIDPKMDKERWILKFQFDPLPPAIMTHWRPLSAPPASIPAPAPRP